MKRFIVIPEQKIISLFVKKYISTFHIYFMFSLGIYAK